MKALQKREERGKPTKPEKEVDWDEFSVFKGLDLSQGILPYLKPK